MVNTNIQAPIPLEGLGFVAKKNGNFEPGEYKRLTNVELVEGSLRSRRSVKSIFGDSYGINMNVDTNMGDIIGYMNDYAIVVSPTTTGKQVAVNKGSRVELWLPSKITTPTGSNSFQKLVGFFRYNSRNYWLNLRFSSDTTSYIRYRVYSGSVDTLNDVPQSYVSDSYFNGLTSVEPLEILSSASDFNKFDHRNFFISGERLWIVTSTGIYFSKATDPTKFAVVDGGGFFKFPDSKINYAFALNNVIYVCCDNGIYAINYNVDPNTDAVIRKISDTGADQGCVFENVPFVINQVGIYSIQNNYLEKFMDNEFDLGEDYYKSQLSAFEDYLIVHKYVDINYEKYSGTRNTSPRTNLIPNPSFEGALTGNSLDALYFLRDANTGKKYYGTKSYRSTKRSDHAQTVRTNLVLNPGFENNLDYTLDSTFVSLVRDGTVKYNGVASLLTKFDAGNQGVGDYTFTLHSGITIPDTSKTYAYSVRVRYSNTGIKSDTDIKLKIVWLTANQSYNGESVFDLINPQATPTKGEWYERFSGGIVPPPNTAYAQLVVAEKEAGALNEFSPNDDCNIHYDNVSFYEDKTFIAPSNYNVPRYFDGSTTHPYFTFAWTGTPGNSSSVMKGAVGSDYFAILRQTVTVPVSPGVPYVFGLGIYTPISRTYTLYINEYDNASVLKRTISIPLEKGAVNAWQYYVKNYTPSADCTKITYSLLTSDGVPLLPNDTTYVDALILETSSSYKGYFDGSFASTSNISYAWTGTAHASTSTMSTVTVLRGIYANSKAFDPMQKGNTLGYNVYFINMKTGSVHVMDFKDARESNNPGYVSHIGVNPYKDSNGNYNCFFITSRLINDSDTSLTYDSNFYYINSYYDNAFVDYACSDSKVLMAYRPKIEVEIDSFVPDGSEYLVKKFRSIQIEGKYPINDLAIQFGFDNRALSTPIEISQELSDRPHSPSRVGINQRCRALTIKFINQLSNTPLPEDQTYGAFEVSNLQTYWGYTQHAPTTKGKGL